MNRAVLPAGRQAGALLIVAAAVRAQTPAGFDAAKAFGATAVYVAEPAGGRPVRCSPLMAIPNGRADGAGSPTSGCSARSVSRSSRTGGNWAA